MSIFAFIRFIFNKIFKIFAKPNKLKYFDTQTLGWMDTNNLNNLDKGRK